MIFDEALLAGLLINYIKNYPSIQFLKNLEDADLSNRLFSRWSEELKSQNQHLHHACELEIYAFLKRFAASVQIDSSLINLVEKMTAFIARNFTQPIGVKDIADEERRSVFKIPVGYLGNSWADRGTPGVKCLPSF